MRNFLIAVLIILVAGTGAYYLWQHSENKSQAQDANSQGAVLQSLSMPQDGFVVIQQDNSGQPGNILGASGKLSQGSHNSVTVQTNAPLSPQTRYFASLYTDINNDGVFEQGADKVMVGPNGQLMQRAFTPPPKPGGS